jgi:hypothetical protein
MKKIVKLNETEINQFITRVMNEAIAGGSYDTSSIDKLKSKYPNGINVNMTSEGSSTFANGIDTINGNNPKIRSILNTILAGCGLTNIKCSRKVSVVVGGGASSVGSSSGYDNKSLATRRRDNFIEWLNGLDIILTNKNFITISAGQTKVGKATVKNSPEAQKEQYVSAKITSQGRVDVKGVEGDNTNVSLPGYDKKGPKQFDDTTDVKNFKRVCVKIPSGLVNEYKKKIKEFKIENGLDSVPFGVYDL